MKLAVGVGRARRMFNGLPAPICWIKHQFVSDAIASSEAGRQADRQTALLSWLPARCYTSPASEAASVNDFKVHWSLKQSSTELITWGQRCICLPHPCKKRLTVHGVNKRLMGLIIVDVCFGLQQFTCLSENQDALVRWTPTEIW